MYILRVKDHFDAAHFLPWHEGKCKNLHGHRWEVEVEVKEQNLDNNGVVIDFGVIKNLLNSILPDHECLNDSFLSNPTAEMIAYVLYHRIIEELSLQFGVVSPNVIGITIWESPNCSVTYRPEET